MTTTTTRKQIHERGRAMNDNTTPDPAWDESEDIEELFVEAKRFYNPSPHERWNLAVDLARARCYGPPSSTNTPA